MTDLFDFDHPREHGALSRRSDEDRVSLAYVKEQGLGLLPGSPAWITLDLFGQPATISNGPRLGILDVERIAPVYTEFSIPCERCGAPVVAQIVVGPLHARVECGACGQGYIVEPHLPDDPEDDCRPAEASYYQ